MKSYDDLQRFKEKTQTNNIKFKDMSEQTLESDSSHWAIIKQLLNDNNGDSALERGQSIDVIQPQPINKNQFSSQLSAHQVVKSFVAAPSVASQDASLFDSIAATLKPLAEPASAPAEPTPPPAETAEPTPPPAETAVASSALLSWPAPAQVPLLQQAAAQLSATPAPAENAPRYKQLFHSRHAGQAAGVTKDALLKPLLEKIAVCR
ncbi:cellulose biosynthesis protein BcsO [Winslowiella iniecta]|uniref:Cellulose biosynthesis protein BcsO n=1 Tax=Winslowiella iniecta TaxID=1560201 RepID=A0A0L7T821_9GAMM|nr:cellulose biosynthesis protein BcsO [Winslowiella iniecta]KOC91520.1 hypothetical protein NG42_04540 [Winslowiella iniecta]KOC94529.1 hypothetical protein NG43_04965 [Winslowiella iniecta]